MTHAATPLILNVGTTYQTRAGDVATIRAMDDTGGSYRYLGDIVSPDGRHVRIASFSDSGRYVIGKETDFDIVSVCA